MASSGSVTTTKPCKCCSTGIPAKMECRQRGGTASLVGCPEIVNTSTPPRSYRHGTINGSTESRNYGLNPCFSTYGTSICNYSGTTQYDKATGVVTYGGVNECDGVTFGVGVPCYAGCPSSCTEVFSCTQTGWTTAPSGVCCYNGANYILTVNAARTAVFDDEDLESDAVARLLAGAGGTWGSWNLTGDGVSGCLPQICCLAQWQTRTTGFSFAYNEGQFRISNSSGSLAPSSNYNCKVKIYRRVSGVVGPFFLYQTLVFPVTTDGSGDIAPFAGDVPNDQGFETYSGSAGFFLAP